MTAIKLHLYREFSWSSPIDAYLNILLIILNFAYNGNKETDNSLFNKFRLQMAMLKAKKT